MAEADVSFLMDVGAHRTAAAGAQYFATQGPEHGLPLVRGCAFSPKISPGCYLGLYLFEQRFRYDGRVSS